jgi:methanogenic corrinoid protein MtbC1
MACLARAIDAEVIPTLALRHRNPDGTGISASVRVDPALAHEVEICLTHLLAGRHADIDAQVARLRQSGCSVESVYLDLLKPVARRLGELWCNDDVDFAQVTVATGGLQRVMRELSPAFASEVEAAPHAHRALFVQAEGEQHSFGLSMLAEFFRRAGWDVLGSVGTAAADPIERVRHEWVDLIGFSIGSLPRLQAMKRTIAGVRSVSLNPALVVMVGGPLFDVHPELLAEVNADGSAADARQALRLAESLVRARQAGSSGA